MAAQILRQTVQLLHITAFQEPADQENVRLTFSDQLAVKLNDGRRRKLNAFVPPTNLTIGWLRNWPDPFLIAASVKDLIAVFATVKSGRNCLQLLYVTTMATTTKEQCTAPIKVRSWNRPFVAVAETVAEGVGSSPCISTLLAD
jgi:hypothetical protein